MKMFKLIWYISHVHVVVTDLQTIHPHFCQSTSSVTRNSSQI